MKKYIVMYGIEYIPTPCDDIKIFDTMEEAQEFVKTFPKCYVYRITEKEA